MVLMPDLQSALKIFIEHGESRKRSVSDRAPSVLNSVKVMVLKEGGMHNDHIATTNNQKTLLQILVEKN